MSDFLKSETDQEVEKGLAVPEDALAKLKELENKYGVEAVNDAIRAATKKPDAAYAEVLAANLALKESRAALPHRPKANLYHSPAAGFVWNPMRSYPVNSPCLCGSGKKYKKCHRGQMAECVTPKEAKSISEKIKAVLG